MHPKRNFLRPLIPCVVLGVGGVASIAATVAMLAPITNSMASREARGATQPQPQPPKPPIEVGNELVRITASLDRTEVGVGEELTLTESVLVSFDKVITSMTHSDSLIGGWDEKKKELVLFSPDGHLDDWPDTGLPHLVNSVRVSKSSGKGNDPYSIHEAERKGVTFTFKAERPGIYLIHARWWNNNQEEPIQYYISNPVVLIVRGN
jgi:hypothetical protein